jgi:hypothetical protein
MDLLKVELGSCSETCPTSSHDVNDITSVKVEEMTDIQEEDKEEDLVLVRLPKIKSELEVSCMSVHY